MKNFSEYINDREENSLNEDITLLALAVLGFPTVAALTAYGGSLLVKGYSRFLSGIINKIIITWKGIFHDMKNIGKKEVIEVVREAKSSPAVRKEMSDEEKNKKLYEDELRSVLSAIHRKDFDEAKKELSKVNRKISNLPDVQKMLIGEITAVLKEPPLYVVSPGNKTYQAIKKVLNIKLARAAAEASKLAVEKGLNK